MWRSGLVRRVLLPIAALTGLGLLGGCVAYPGYYGYGAGYPAYGYAAPYYGYPSDGYVAFGFGGGGWHDHDWHGGWDHDHDRGHEGGWRR